MEECNEERSIGRVIGDIPQDLVTEIVVVNNGSTDSTARVASSCGATVIEEERRGYGQACLAGIDYIKNSSYLPDIIVFLDADYSDYPQEMKDLVSADNRGRIRSRHRIKNHRRKAKRGAFASGACGQLHSYQACKTVLPCGFYRPGSFQGHKI